MVSHKASLCEVTRPEDTTLCLGEYLPKMTDQTGIHVQQMTDNSEIAETYADERTRMGLHTIYRYSLHKTRHNEHLQHRAIRYIQYTQVAVGVGVGCWSRPLGAVQ